MAKLKPEDSGEIIFDDDDSPIGLTQAFSTIDDAFEQFGYDDASIDDPFADDEQASWDYNDKWAGFDWNAPLEDEYAESEIAEGEFSDESDAEPEGELEAESDEDGGIEDGGSGEAESDGEEPIEDEVPGEDEEEPVEDESAEDAPVEEETAGEEPAEDGELSEGETEESAGKEPAEEELAEEDAEPAEEGEEPASAESDEREEKPEKDEKPKGKHGRHAAGASGASAAVAAAKKAAHAAASEDSPVVPVGAKKPELTERQLKQRKTRRFLLGLLIVLALVIVGVGYYAYQLFAESAVQAEQQTQEQVSEAAAQTDIANATGNDAVQTASHTAEVPNLAQLIGKNQDEAIALLEHGAMVSNTRAVSEKGSAIKSSVTITLTSEPVDSRTGSPTVYLGLNKEGVIVQAGYSASASSLGFGTLSFRDAVNTEHVVEKTLQDAGISVPEGSVTVPEDSSAYSTYTSDGKTLVRERCSFEGEAQVGDLPCTWSAVLSYDYTTMNLTGNMNDTVRVIYAYVTSPDAVSDEDDEDEDEDEKKD